MRKWFISSSSGSWRVVCANVALKKSTMLTTSAAQVAFKDSGTLHPSLWLTVAFAARSYLEPVRSLIWAMSQTEGKTGQKEDGLGYVSVWCVLRWDCISFPEGRRRKKNPLDLFVCFLIVQPQQHPARFDYHKCIHALSLIAYYCCRRWGSWLRCWSEDMNLVLISCSSWGVFFYHCFKS